MHHLCREYVPETAIEVPFKELYDPKLFPQRDIEFEEHILDALLPALQTKSIFEQGADECCVELCELVVFTEYFIVWHHNA